MAFVDQKAENDTVKPPPTQIECIFPSSNRMHWGPSDFQIFSGTRENPPLIECTGVSSNFAKMAFYWGKFAVLCLYFKFTRHGTFTNFDVAFYPISKDSKSSVC